MLSSVGFGSRQTQSQPCNMSDVAVPDLNFAMLYNRPIDVIYTGKTIVIMRALPLIGMVAMVTAVKTLNSK